MSRRVVVYTAIAGAMDVLQDPRHISPACDYVCFTDNPHCCSDVWQIRSLSGFLDDPVRRAKLPKILPHRFFAGYEISIWVDGNFDILDDLAKLAEYVLKDHDLAFYRHPEGQSCIYEEALACLNYRKDNAELISKQIDGYRKQGMPEGYGLPACMVIFRRHNQNKVVEAMEHWWKEILSQSRRDQLSFPFVSWKRDLDYNLIDENSRDNRYLKCKQHSADIRLDNKRRAMPKADVICFSFPKSGRTWIRYFLCEYFKAAFNIEMDLEFRRTEHTPNILFEHEYMDIYQDCPDEPRMLFNKLVADQRLIVLVRDPRDVVVSFYHQKKHRERCNIGEIDSFVKSPIYGIERQANFVRQLLSYTRKHRGDLLLVSYEALIENPESGFKRLLTYIVGPDIDQAAFSAALEKSSFDQMQAHEKQLAINGSLARTEGRLGLANWTGDERSLKVRQGRVGGFRQALGLKTRFGLLLKPNTRSVVKSVNSLTRKLTIGAKVSGGRIPENGIVFVATGEKYCEEARAAVRSVKKHMPDCHVTLFGEHIIDDPVFDHQILIPEPAFGFLDKVRSLLRSPYKKTLYLDTDIHLCGHLSEVLDLLVNYEMVFTYAPKCHAKFPTQDGGVDYASIEEGIPWAFPQFNAGVLAFKHCWRVRRVLNAWISNFYRHLKVYLLPENDQPALQQAVYENKVSFTVLPPEYNLRLPYPATLAAPVKVLHGRSYDFDTLERQVNRHLHTLRCYIPSFDTIPDSQLKGMAVSGSQSTKQLAELYEKYKKKEADAKECYRLWKGQEQQTKELYQKYSSLKKRIH